MYEIGTPVVILPPRTEGVYCEFSHCEGVVVELAFSDSNMLIRLSSGVEVWIVSARVVSKAELAYRAELGL